MEEHLSEHDLEGICKRLIKLFNINHTLILIIQILVCRECSEWNNHVLLSRILNLDIERVLPKVRVFRAGFWQNTVSTLNICTKCLTGRNDVHQVGELIVAGCWKTNASEISSDEGCVGK